MLSHSLPTTQTAQAVVEGVHPRAEAMAKAMIDNYQNCDVITLCRAGFSRHEIDAHHETATRVARDRFMRDDTPPDYDRAERIRAASREILTLCPGTPRIVARLKARGFQQAEIDDILDEALARAGNAFGATAGQPGVGE